MTFAGITTAALLRHGSFALLMAALSAGIVSAMARIGVMDRPDSRKAHHTPTPKGGGLGVVTAFMVGVLVLYHQAGFARLADPYFRGVIVGAMAIAVVAFLDDLRDWPFTVKLGTQILAALLTVASGLWVRFYILPGSGTVDLGWLGMVATLGWIVLATNAMNFIDGLNGLAAGVSMIACLFLAPVAALHGGWFVYAAALLLAAGLLGFLPFNFPRARIFMGDVGSQFCGFILAVLGVAAARFEQVGSSVLIVPMLLSGVLFDVIFTLVRRALAHEPLARAHRSHIYQVAHRSGLDALTITMVHWGFAAWGGAMMLLTVSGGPWWRWVGVLLLLPPQLAWLAWIAGRSRHAGLRW